MKVYRIVELPNKNFDKKVFFEVIGKSPFLIDYSFKERTEKLVLFENCDIKMQMLHNFIHGIKFSEVYDYQELFDVVIISGYTTNDDILNGIYNLPLFEGSLIIGFIPANEIEVEQSKSFIEKILSSKKVRETNSEQSLLGFKLVTTSQREIFLDTEESLLLNNALNSINESLIKGGATYKVFFIFPKDKGLLEEYVKSRVLVLGERIFKSFSYESFKKISNFPALPYGSVNLQALLNFNYGVKHNYVVDTQIPRLSGDISIGYFVENGVKATDTLLKIDSSTINLGLIITGLPGVGKTTEAMAIADQLTKLNKKPKIIIIAPTSEWANFAIDHKMNLIRIYDDLVPINFFRKPDGINKEKFYESLAMILSSASNSGPFENPMEKCMLNAFRKVYENENEPDPIKVYNQIESSIIELHAKKTNTGVKYTKHGENIRSELENLRIILRRPEYAAKEGIKIEELLENGVVFDISNASGNTKQYFYALILNLVYSITSKFDFDGDNELRLAIFLEEAQMIFGDEDSSAVQDVKQRIQDFRKQGIGLVLLAHNANEIESSIRRMCQIKMYFRQPYDIAQIAIKDLSFSLAAEQDVILKLKMMESGICALNCVVKEGDFRVPHETIFIKTLNYVFMESSNKTINDYKRPCKLIAPTYVDSIVHIKLLEDYARIVNFIQIIFIGEEVYLGNTELKSELDIKLRMLKGKEYTINILDKKKRILKELKIEADSRIDLTI
ncbi:MAG: hypothetical protein ACP5TL_00990 [Candidatus Micrarchaeia archaeon]